MYEIEDSGCTCCIAPCISPITRQKLTKGIGILTLIIFSTIGLCEFLSSEGKGTTEPELSKASAAFINETHTIILLHSLKEVSLSTLLIAAATYGHVWVLVTWIVLATACSGWVSIVTAWALYLLAQGKDEDRLWEISITGMIGLLSIFLGIFSAVFLTIHIKAAKEFRRMRWTNDVYICRKCAEGRERKEKEIEETEEKKIKKEEGKGDEPNSSYFLPNTQQMNEPKFGFNKTSTFRPGPAKIINNDENYHSSNYLNSDNPSSLY